jgi:hypothetical protein
MLVVLISLIGAASCKKDVAPAREDLPISISIEVPGNDVLQIDERDICDRIGNMFTSIVSSNQGDRKYLVTSGWNFQFEEDYFGQINMVFIGNTPMSVGDLSMKEMMELAIENHTEVEKKIAAELIFYSEGQQYQSVEIDRTWATLGFSDPYKTELLEYELGNEPIRCLENQTVLSFEYDFNGYVYNRDRTDSLLIETSSFKVSSQILN